MKVVLDANVVVGAVGWNGESWLLFIKLARRHLFAYATEATLRETQETAIKIITRHRFKHGATARLTWYLQRVRLVKPVPLGKRRSRDLKDDPYLAAALAAGAKVIVTHDRDLLALEKPFGIEILTPAQLLSRLRPGD